MCLYIYPAVNLQSGSLNKQYYPFIIVLFLYCLVPMPIALGNYYPFISVIFSCVLHILMCFVTFLYSVKANYRARIYVTEVQLSKLTCPFLWAQCLFIRASKIILVFSICWIVDVLLVIIYWAISLHLQEFCTCYSMLIRLVCANTCKIHWSRCLHWCI